MEDCEHGPRGHLRQQEGRRGVSLLATLWPLSRESMPKQFVELVGPRSTFQQVLARVTDPEQFAPPVIITNAEFRFVVAEQARESD